MNKTEYMNTINEKLTTAQGLCADLRKLRNLQTLAGSIDGRDELVSMDKIAEVITAKEAELKSVRGELQRARRIVKKMEEIEAIESGKAPAPAKKRVKKTPGEAKATQGAAEGKDAPKSSKAAKKTNNTAA